jgi:amino acid transporter
MATPAAQPRSVELDLDKGLKRDIGKIGLLFTGVGSIIGSGWLFGALNASQLVGPASILAWILGAIMIILVALAYAELGVMIPVAGGVVRFPHFAFGSFASYTAGWITWLSAAATVPIEVLAAVQYATPYLPWLMTGTGDEQVLSGPGLAVSIVMLFVFSLINMLGVKAFARFNNVLVWWKLAVIILVVIVFMVAAFNTDHFFSAEFGGFAPYGYDEVFAALPAAGIIFSYLGFRQGVEFAGETDNPQRNVPFAVIGSVVITGIIYVALQIAFIGALPDRTLADGWSELSFDEIAGPLAGLALLLGISWLAVLLYIDAVVSPADTGLIFAGLTTRLGYAAGRNGNAPQSLTKLNARGVPWVSVVVMFVIGCLFFLPFPAWSQLVGFIVSGTVLSFGTGPLVVAALRRQLPDQERRFRLPGGDVLLYLAFLASNLIVYWTGWTTNWKLFLGVLAGYLVLIGYYATAKDRSRIPPLQFQAGWWMIPWLGGLALLSWLGHYEGGIGVLTFGWGELTVVVFSVLIFMLAVRTRLSPQECVQNFRRIPTDDEPRTA